MTVAQREVDVVPHAAPPSAITRVAVLQEIRARLTVDETTGNDSNNLEEENRDESRKSNENEKTSIADS